MKCLYRVGVRWESLHVIVAATYDRQFDGAGGTRFEVGVMVLTNPLKIFCRGRRVQVAASLTS